MRCGWILRVFAVVIMCTGCNSYSGGLDRLIHPATSPIKLHSDDFFEFTEGPCCSGDGTLYFTDGPVGKVYRMDGFNQFTAVVTGAGRPDGMMVDHNGNLVVCDFKNKSMDLYSPEGKLIKTLADSYEGKDLNGPNDCVIDRKGGIYFTDPSFNREHSPQGVEGVYYIHPNGKIIRVAEGFDIPNGIILTPDEQRLIAVDYGNPLIHAFDVNPDGSLSNGHIWAKVALPEIKQGEEERRNQVSIGVAMDTEGNLYVSTGLGMEVFDKKGRSLGILQFDEFERPTNMTFDRNDPYTMILATGKGMYSLKMRVKGISFPQFD